MSRTVSPRCSQSTSDNARTFGGLGLQSFGIYSNSTHSREIITKPGNSRVDLHGVLALGGVADADREVDRFPRELLDLVEPACLRENSGKLEHAHRPPSGLVSLREHGVGLHLIHPFPKHGSSVSRMLRSVPGATSLPWITSTAVHFPHRTIRCEPSWRTSSQPCCRRIFSNSLTLIGFTRQSV